MFILKFYEGFHLTQFQVNNLYIRAEVYFDKSFILWIHEYF